MDKTSSIARRYSAFTLVEVLLVVVILSILATLVVLQFASADSQTRENSAKMNLFRIRAQLELYKQHHNSGYPSLANFVDQLLESTDDLGNTAPSGTPGFRYGPYLLSIPTNPFTRSAVIGGDFTAGSSDWYYNENTGEIRANDDIAHQSW